MVLNASVKPFWLTKVIFAQARVFYMKFTINPQMCWNVLSFPFFSLHFNRGQYISVRFEINEWIKLCNIGKDYYHYEIGGLLVCNCYLIIIYIYILSHYYSLHIPGYRKIVISDENISDYSPVNATLCIPIIR